MSGGVREDATCNAMRLSVSSGALGCGLASLAATIAPSVIQFPAFPGYATERRIPSFDVYISGVTVAATAIPCPSRHD